MLLKVRTTINVLILAQTTMFFLNITTEFYCLHPTKIQRSSCYIKTVTHDVYGDAINPFRFATVLKPEAIQKVIQKPRNPPKRHAIPERAFYV